MSDDPQTAGLDIDNRFACPAGVAAYTLAKLSTTPNTLALVAAGDDASEVAGIFTNARGQGSSAGVGFCGTRGRFLPMLSDGADALSPGDRVTVSSVTDGRIEGVSSGGIGCVASGAPAVADAVVLVLFDGAGAGGSPGSGDLQDAYDAGNTIAIDAATPVQLSAPDDRAMLEFYSDTSDKVVATAQTTVAPAITLDALQVKGAAGVPGAVAVDAAGRSVWLLGGTGGDGDGAGHPPGRGGDVRLEGGDGGLVNPEHLTSHGGECILNGGTCPVDDPEWHHGGVIIGFEHTDFVIVGHEPVDHGGSPYKDRGDIINLGCLGSTEEIAAGTHTLRFSVKQTSHLVDVEEQWVAGSNGTGIDVFAGDGADGITSTDGGRGATLKLTAGTGGDAGASSDPGAGGDIYLRAGAAGVGGDAVGGDVFIEAAAGAGAGAAGTVYVGADDANTSQVVIGDTDNDGVTIKGATTAIHVPTVGALVTFGQTAGLGEITPAAGVVWNANLTLATSAGNRLITMATPASGQVGNLKMVGGEPNTGGSHGGDVYVVGGAKGTSSIGGSVLIDGSAGASSPAQDGYVQIGQGGATNTILVGDASAVTKLGFWKASGVTRPSGVGVDAASIHAALVSLGLITA